MTLVLLDRDGVINSDSADYICSPAQFEPIPDSIQAIAQLVNGGHQVAVCTNQSGLGRGLFTERALTEIHAKLHGLLNRHGVALNAVYYCPHLPTDKCACRKPAPGMLVKAISDFSTPADKTWFIGDSVRDMQAALAAGCNPILVRTGNGATHEKEVRRLGVNRIHNNLNDAVSSLLGETI